MGNILTGKYIVFIPSGAEYNDVESLDTEMQVKNPLSTTTTPLSGFSWFYRQNKARKKSTINSLGENPWPR